LETEAPVAHALGVGEAALHRVVIATADPRGDSSEGTFTQVSRSEDHGSGLRLEDESGSIDVDPSGAELRNVRVRSIAPGEGHELRRRLSLPTGMGAPIWSEEYFLPGDAVLAVGRVEHGPTGARLTGGRDLLLSGGTERELFSSQRWTRWLGAALFLAGLLIGGLTAGALWPAALRLVR
jgi:hypothetical protein